MSNFLTKQLLKSFLPQLPEALKGLNATICDDLKNAPLTDPEIEATYIILVDENNDALIVKSFFDAESKMIRAENPILVTEFLKNLIEKSI